jgi:hypothetical protein
LAALVNITSFAAALPLDWSLPLLAIISLLQKGCSKSHLFPAQSLGDRSSG